jgi:hypothetical protein
MATTIPSGYTLNTLTFAVTGSLIPQTITCLTTSVPFGSVATDLSEWETSMLDTGKPFESASLADMYTVIASSSLKNAGGVLTSAVNALSLPGTGTWEPPSSNTPCIIAKRTALAGPSHRGRMFAPAGILDDGNVNANGIINAGYLAVVQGNFNAAFTRMVTVGLQPVIGHGASPTPTACTSFTVTPLVGTFRRRIRR